MKAVCIIASPNVVIDGDVIFFRLNSFDYAIKSKFPIKFTKKTSWFACGFTKDMPLKIKFLWLWHMVLLRKSHVYLTNVM